MIQPTRFEHDQGMLLAGSRQYHLFSNVQQTIPQQWQNFKQQYADLFNDSSRSFGATCMSDANGFEYMCAVEVDNFEQLAPDTGRMIIKAQYYAVFRHQGDIATIGQTWQQIHQWIATSDYQHEHAPCFELYDERYNAKTGFGLVEIWIAIKQP